VAAAVGRQPFKCDLLIKQYSEVQQYELHRVHCHPVAGCLVHCLKFVRTQCQALDTCTAHSCQDRQDSFLQSYQQQALDMIYFQPMGA